MKCFKGHKMEIEMNWDSKRMGKIILFFERVGACGRIIIILTSNIHPI